jgi:diacylglycerol O-acyltransferase
MKQLSGTDNLFLQLEHGNQYMHVAGLGIYDPSTAPGGSVRFKEILEFFEARLDLAPVFRRRLVTVPLDLDRPYWIEDGDIDVEFHVRHIALPQPGDWRQLCIQVARLHSRPLDRSKPLWEVYVIEGLDNIQGLPAGSFALYIKFHHAAVDGEAGTELMKAIHSFSPDEAVDEIEKPPRFRDREPSPIELGTRTLINTAQRVPKFARFSLKTATRLAGVGSSYASQLMSVLREAGVPSVEIRKPKGRRPPVTRFSGRVSAHRVVELDGLPLEGMKNIRNKVAGSTLNDIFLAVVGGAVRAYLDDKGELPDRSLTAQVPMTTRGADKGGDVGNQIAIGVMPLHTEIADPIDRLLAISKGSDKAKATMAVVGKDLAANLFDLLPAAASELVTKRMMLPTMNIVVSNVRGPDVAMYMAGARMVNFAPVSVAMDGLGLNVTGFSYHGTMWVCSVACREMMPDPAFFSECLQASFAAMVRAADALPDVTEAAKAQSPVRRRKPATARKAKVRKAAVRKKKSPARARPAAKAKAVTGTGSKTRAKSMAKTKMKAKAKARTKAKVRARAKTKAGKKPKAKQKAA